MDPFFGFSKLLALSYITYIIEESIIKLASGF